MARGNRYYIRTRSRRPHRTWRCSRLKRKGSDREKAAKEAEDAAEKLYAAEEDAIIAVKGAEAALVAGPQDQKAVLEAKLAKAKRALAVAERQRKAAGLPDLP